MPAKIVPPTDWNVRCEIADVTVFIGLMMTRTANPDNPKASNELCGADRFKTACPAGMHVLERRNLLPPAGNLCAAAPKKSVNAFKEEAMRCLFAGLAGALISCAALADTLPQEGSYLAENRTAMSRMMAGMAVKPTGDVDTDFAAMMIPHHQGAIDMAVAELRYGKNPQLRRIAQEIIVDQQQEIAAMKLALGQKLPPSTPAPTMTGMAMHQGK